MQTGVRGQARLKDITLSQKTVYRRYQNRKSDIPTNYTISLYEKEYHILSLFYVNFRIYNDLLEIQPRLKTQIC